MHVIRIPNGDIQTGDYKYRINQEYTTVVYIVTRKCNFKCTYCGAYNEKETSLTDTTSSPPKHMSVIN